MTIRIFEENDHESVIALWTECFNYTSPHNDPVLSVERKTAMDDGLFFVSSDSIGVTGTVMAGWDGHRGWIYSLAVSSRARNRGIGTDLLEHAVQELKRRGCPKVNLQVMPGNTSAEEFYRNRGFSTEQRVSMGRILI
jgi:hypothetical protein